MAYMITEDCCNCQACEEECPNNAISEGDNLASVINPNLCTECVGVYDEPQCVNVCPVDAIVLNPDYKELKEQLLEKYKRLHAA